MMSERIFVFDELGGVRFLTDEAKVALHAVGLIWVGEGHWCCASTLDLRQWPELSLCTFCHARPVKWDVRARQFQLAQGFMSSPHWDACESCGLLIAAGMRYTLNHRSLMCIARESPGEMCQQWQQELLDLFWHHFQSIERARTPYGVSDG